ncbi:MAG: hypothetical protein ACHQJ4_02650 [Ignavibacteria bacterium]
MQIIRVVSISLLFFLSAGMWNMPYSQLKESNGRDYDPSKKFTIYAFSTYVSSATVQNNLDSPDPIERAGLTDISGGFGFGTEFDFKPIILNLDLVYYLSVEYLHLDQSGIQYEYSDGINIYDYTARDKFTIVPLELGIKWPLPVGTDNFKIYIGGGGGIYVGTHTRYVDNISSQTYKMTPGFSLNVMTGVDYYVGKNLAASIELKFRDAAFDTYSKYNYITTLPNPFTTRLIADGVRVTAGIKYDF